MSKKEYFLLMVIGPTISFLLGFWMGKTGCDRYSSKNYPIEVRSYWPTDGYQNYQTMEADSVKGDTVYKDGLSIINNKITHISFK